MQTAIFRIEREIYVAANGSEPDAAYVQALGKCLAPWMRHDARTKIAGSIDVNLADTKHKLELLQQTVGNASGLAG